MSDRLKSIGEMTGSLSDRERMELNEFRKKLVGMPTRSPDKSITTTEKQVTMSDPDMFDELYQLYENEVRKGYKGSFNDFLIDRREADVDVPVAGQFEDQLMRMYEAAVEQGYKGTFFDFLIDQMDEEFDPASTMRVSRLPEGIMQLMNMMQNKRTT